MVADLTACREDLRHLLATATSDPLRAGSDGTRWSNEQPLYSLPANAHNEADSEGVGFVPRDVRKLAVGDVLYAARDANDAAGAARVWQAEFAAEACEAQ